MRSSSGLISLLLVFLLAGCGGESPDTVLGPQPVPAPAPPASPSPGASLLKIDNCTIKPQSGTAPLAVFFRATAEGGGVALDWMWEFGDGSFGQGAIVDHTYNLAGVFGAKVTVSTPSGEHASCAGKVTVSSPVQPPDGPDPTPTPKPGKSPSPKPGKGPPSPKPGKGPPSPKPGPPSPKPGKGPPSPSPSP